MPVHDTDPNRSTQHAVGDARSGTDEPLRLSVHPALQDHWISITLTLVSIIEGLAFAELASRLPSLIRTAISLRSAPHNFSWTWLARYDDVFNLLPALLASVFCFVLILRILRTYVTAVLDYRKYLDFTEFLIMFLVGMLQYLLIDSAVSSDPQPDALLGGLVGIRPTAFAVCSLAISSLAVAGYFSTLKKLVSQQKDTASMDSRRFASEVTLQAANLSGIAVTLTGSVIILVDSSIPTLLLSVAAMTTALILNIWYSITKTFNGPTHEAPPSVRHSKDFVIDAITTGVRRPEARPLAQSSLVQASENDVTLIAENLVDEFGYIYNYICEDGVSRWERAVAVGFVQYLLRFSHGKASMGFTRFHKLALNDQFVAFALLRPQRESLIPQVLWAAAFITGYFRFHPQPRLVLFLKKLIEMIHLVDSAESTHSLEYIFVLPGSRGHGVGGAMLRQMVAHACDIGATSVSANVRSKNHTALRMFSNNGFTVRQHTPEPIEKIRNEKGYVINVIANVKGSGGGDDA